MTKYKNFKVRNNRGIGLVELLVVIAIVAILAAIGSNVLNRARAAAQEAGCISNLRTLGAAGIMYANDREGLLPDAVDWRSERENRLAHSLIPYIYGHNIPGGRSDLYTSVACPIALGHTEFRTFDNPADEAGTYGINQYAHGTNVRESSMGDYAKWSDSNAPLRYIHRFQQPERTPFFLDGAGQNDSWGNRYSVFSNQARAKNKVEKSFSGGWQTPYLHSGKTIAVVFLDGHVELVSHERVSATGVDGLNWTGK